MSRKVRLDEVLERITNTSNPEEHKELIEQLCKICKGWEIYNHLSRSGKWKSSNAFNVLEDFIYNEEELIFEENKPRESQFLRLTFEAYEDRNFKYLADVMTSLVLEHATKTAENQFEIDTRDITIMDFCSEIDSSLGNPLYALNYFAESDHFEKQRDSDFVERELVLLTVCFESFYNNLQDEKLIDRLA